MLSGGRSLNNDKKPFYSYSEYIGRTTNNTAEYKAVIKALEKVIEFSPSSIEIYSDSQLLVRQMSGEYKVRKEHLRKLYNEIILLKTKFSKLVFYHVPRTHHRIKEADRLCNKTLDNLQKKFWG